MTQEAPPETIDLAIVSCEACDQLFLESPRRGSCPTCGGAAALIFFQFEGGPDGLHLLAHPELAALPADAPAEASIAGEAPPAPEPELELPEGDEPLMPFERAEVECGAYVAGDDLDTAEMYQALVLAGASHEDAETAVGRLIAVRGLLKRLAVMGETSTEAP